MKKLKLGAKDVQDILSRDELRTIGGGAGSGGTGSGDCNCNNGNDCDKSKGEDCMADCTHTDNYVGHCAKSS